MLPLWLAQGPELGLRQHGRRLHILWRAVRRPRLRAPHWRGSGCLPGSGPPESQTLCTEPYTLRSQLHGGPGRTAGAFPQPSLHRWPGCAVPCRGQMCMWAMVVRQPDTQNLNPGLVQRCQAQRRPPESSARCGPPAAAQPSQPPIPGPACTPWTHLGVAHDAGRLVPAGQLQDLFQAGWLHAPVVEQQPLRAVLAQRAPPLGLRPAHAHDVKRPGSPRSMHRLLCSSHCGLSAPPGWPAPSTASQGPTIYCLDSGSLALRAVQRAAAAAGCAG